MCQQIPGVGDDGLSFCPVFTECVRICVCVLFLILFSDPFERYCKGVAETNMWGGQLEVRFSCEKVT